MEFIEKDRVASANPSEASIAQGSKLRKRRSFSKAILPILCATQLLTACCCIISYARNLNQESKSLVVINWDDPFVAERAKQFNLSQVIQQYDQVIIAIESYYEDNGAYPLGLSALVPEYLSEVLYLHKKR